MPEKYDPFTLFSELPVCLSAFLPVCLLMSAGVARAQCYATPQAAIVGAQSTSSSMRKSEAGGYRVVSTESDPLLQRIWATIASCDHPEWPAQVLPILTRPSIQLMRLHSDGASSPVVVRAGDPIRLWRQEAFLRIQVAGISEQNGSVGQTVRVRLSAARDASSSLPEERSGVVQGPADVEMRP